jgi:hypothetical protein
MSSVQALIDFWSKFKPDPSAPIYVHPLDQSCSEWGAFNQAVRSPAGSNDVWPGRLESPFHLGLHPVPYLLSLA